MNDSAGNSVTSLTSDPHYRGVLYAGDTSGITYIARGDRAGEFVPSTKSPGRFPIIVIFPNPYISGAVYAGSSGGFYASSDNGQNYAAQNSGLPANARVLGITTGADGATLFISVDGKGLFTSADAGKTWSAVVQAPASARNTQLSAAADVQVLYWESATKSLYAAVAGQGDGVYVSRDGGVTWATANKGLPAKTDVFDLLELAAGGIAPSGPTLYAATSAGVFAMANATAGWQEVSTGIPSGSVYSLATYPATAGLLYAGTGSTVYVSNNGGKAWSLVADGLSHMIPAIAVTPGQDTPTVTFVAAGQVARFPAAAGGGGGGIVSTLLLVLVVFLLGWFVLGRYGIVPSMTQVRRRLTRMGK